MTAARARRHWPPRPGVHCIEGGVSVAVFSAHADAIELCLFDDDDRECERRKLAFMNDQLFHDHFDDLKPGQRYGLRAHGPFDPRHGQRFNPNKLLLDPYARRLDRPVRFHRSQLDTGQHPDSHDSASHMAKAVITAPLPPLDANLQTAWHETLIYEAHLKGLTRQHPAIAPEHQGRFKGLAHPAMIEHLVKLGITAIELLPIHTFMHEPRLEKLGLVNYWGYNSLGFFAPHPDYGGDDPLGECRVAIEALHEAGIEVILDVVYNHTAEGDHQGPTLSFKGLDNQSYYRLTADGGRYPNPTGCGNALNASHPRVLQLIMDSLRYWAGEVGVDGFRFDLATTLARGRSSDQLPEGDFEHDGNFLACLMQDPLLATKKLIMEPWDVGPHGYRLGGFPPGTGEWNDRFRDTVRAFWRGDEAMLPAMADALAGSAHIFDHNRRSSSASINFIASHDGFTLHDVTAYEHKHNHANGEDNRDGHGHNLSANYGAEGETDDPAIRRLRQKQARNMAATLFLAQGVPMWLGGDELLRSQKGNNNAYCQDNPANWLSWDADEERQDFLAFVRKLVSLRRAHTLLTQDHFLHGKHEIGWLHPGGRTMTVEDWHNPGSHQIGLKLADDDHTLLILLNAGTRSCPFKLPAGTWRLLLATAERPIRTPLRTSIRIEERSLAILASRDPATGR